MADTDIGRTRKVTLSRRNLLQEFTLAASAEPRTGSRTLLQWLHECVESVKVGGRLVPMAVAAKLLDSAELDALARAADEAVREQCMQS